MAAAEEAALRRDLPADAVPGGAKDVQIPLRQGRKVAILEKIDRSQRKRGVLAVHLCKAAQPRSSDTPAEIIAAISR
jgi:hypothetical protein